MTLPTQPSPRVAALLEKMRRSRGRLIFALDATGSRESTWDLATRLQTEMFKEAASIGGLDVQLLYYRGDDEVQPSAWLPDAGETHQSNGRYQVHGWGHPNCTGAAAYPGRAREREGQRGGLHRRRGRGIAQETLPTPRPASGFRCSCSRRATAR